MKTLLPCVAVARRMQRRRRNDVPAVAANIQFHAELTGTVSYRIRASEHEMSALASETDRRPWHRAEFLERSLTFGTVHIDHDDPRTLARGDPDIRIGPFLPPRG